ncbi:hypothetical protein LINPERHAP2_LOCUS3981 [Linum perenne]|jgi:hypothetical protein
MSRFL